VAEPFTNEELEEIVQRATALASAQQDAGMRTALQVLAEAAANLRVKTPS
jgi:hypothetical protein